MANKHNKKFHHKNKNGRKPFHFFTKLGAIKREFVKLKQQAHTLRVQVRGIDLDKGQGWKIRKELEKVEPKGKAAIPFWLNHQRNVRAEIAALQRELQGQGGVVQEGSGQQAPPGVDSAQGEIGAVLDISQEGEIAPRNIATVNIATMQEFATGGQIAQGGQIGNFGFQQLSNLK